MKKKKIRGFPKIEDINFKKISIFEGRKIKKFEDVQEQRVSFSKREFQISK